MELSTKGWPRWGGGNHDGSKSLNFQRICDNYSNDVGYDYVAAAAYNDDDDDEDDNYLSRHVIVNNNTNTIIIHLSFGILSKASG